MHILTLIKKIIAKIQKVFDHVRISNKKIFLQKATFQIGQKTDVFVIKKGKITALWIVISDLNGEEVVGTFQEEEIHKTKQKEFGTEKVIKIKGNKLYVTWKSYNSSFNSWIDKKRHSIN